MKSYEEEALRQQWEIEQSFTTKPLSFTAWLERRKDDADRLNKITSALGINGLHKKGTQ